MNDCIFHVTGGTGPTSDTGWGCMLRCGQMILGQALMCRHLGRGNAHSIYNARLSVFDCSCRILNRLCLYLFSDWRWVRGEKQRQEYISILNAFIDKKDSYYSIHQIGNCWWKVCHYINGSWRDDFKHCFLFIVAAQMGVGEGKPIGQWYGPNTVAQVLK